MQEKLQGTENTPSVTERRTCPRLRVTSLMYIDIGNVNGGIVTSLSENGLSLTAAAILKNDELSDGPLRLRIQFPGAPEAIEASGEIVWTSSSGKEARVRFVDIGNTPREQIREWISAQISINGLRPEPPRLPKMQLPTSRRAKPRVPKFSFADVASSRVDAECQTELEHLPDIAGQPDELPPPQEGAVAFRDGAEAVASAFESPAFAENGIGKIRSPGNEHTASAKSDQESQRQPSLAIPERRQQPRRQILLFTYAVLAEDNGGLVFNLGEGGLALTAAAALQERHFGKIRVRFPDSGDWFETSGRLAWKNDSGKEAGIEFLNLPEDARARIKEWSSQGEPTGDPETEGAQAHELPGFMDPEEFSAEPFEIPASFEEQPFDSQAFEEHRFEDQGRAPAAPSSALIKTGIKGIFERASVRRRVARIKPPRSADYSARPRTRVTSKALSIAAGVALAVGGWMFLQRTSLNEANGRITQNLPDTQSLHAPAQEPEGAKTKTGAAATGAAPVQNSEYTNEDASTQTAIAKPSVQQIETGPAAPNTPKIAAKDPIAGSESKPKEKSRTQESLAHALGTSSAPHGSDLQPQSLATRLEETKTAPITKSTSTSIPGKELLGNKSEESKSVENKPAASKPVQVAQSLPTPNPNKDANPAPSNLSSAPPQPAASLADMEKEKLLAVSKQPDPPVVARTPVVSVSFDPFPSIRMPKTEKSKKSHEGKSLQMGRLLSRVDPVYPEEARQQGIEGTVRVHAIFNRDGSVQSVIQVSGPPTLVSAAMNAVRQWRYSQTILGGQAMEIEEDVTVLFRLANPATKN